MQFTYAILGAGRQGTAAAYDLAINSSTEKILICDVDLETAEKAAQRVNTLSKTHKAAATQLDVSDKSALNRILQNVDSVLSAVPYIFNLEITKSAVQMKTHLCDMGGFTDIVKQQLEFNSAAKDANISIVPDCGMGPGLINNMGAYVIDLLDQPEEIYIYDAGLPQKPEPPWNYVLTFHINGLTNEMDGHAIFIRNGEITYVETLSEPEFLEFPELGVLEADVTSGGTSTAPWSFLGKVNRYENKVLRFPGHYDWLRGYKALGLFELSPIIIDGKSIIPRDFYHTLLEPKISRDFIQDFGIIHVKGVGKKNGKQTIVRVTLTDYYDPLTGFTAMERLTGWHCSMMMTFQTSGVIKPGAIPQELAVNPNLVMEALAKRGIPHTIDYSFE